MQGRFLSHGLFAWAGRQPTEWLFRHFVCVPTAGIPVEGIVLSIDQPKRDYKAITDASENHGSMPPKMVSVHEINFRSSGTFFDCNICLQSEMKAVSSVGSRISAFSAFALFFANRRTAIWYINSFLHESEIGSWKTIKYFSLVGRAIFRSAVGWGSSWKRFIARASWVVLAFLPCLS